MIPTAPPPVQQAVARDQEALRLNVASFLQALSTLLYNARVHEPDNEVFAAPVARFRESLLELLRDEGQLRLEFVGPDLFASGVRIRAQGSDLRSFRAIDARFRQLGIGGLRITSPLSPEALGRLLVLLARSVRELGPERMNQDLRSAGLESVEALARRRDEIAGADRRTRVLRAYQDAIDLIRGYMIDQDSPAQLSARRAKRVVHRLVDLSYEEGGGFALASLAAIRGHDEYTFNHMVNVCVLAIAFGKHLGLPRTQVAQLGLSALYHDVGKLHIPIEVLNKRGPLSDAEWSLMGNHTVFAARTLFPLLATSPDALPRVLTALQHHQRFDGKGYPKLRVLQRQGLLTRITAIVDSFDAMTTLRIYQGARLPHQALAELQACAGKMYDPRLVRAFIQCMGIYPVGSAVVLASGEVAVVCQANPDPERGHQPRVRLAISAGVRLPEGILVDLADPACAGRQIAGCIDPEQVDLNCAHYAL